MCDHDTDREIREAAIETYTGLEGGIGVDVFLHDVAAIVAFARSQRAAALREAADHLRAECVACRGDGLGEHDADANAIYECEYCGRPMCLLRSRADKIDPEEQPNA